MGVNLDAIRKFGELVLLDPDHVIFQQGDLSREMYIVISGKVNISLVKDKREILLAQLSTGDFFGEMSLLEGLPRSGTAVTVGQSELVVLEEASFRQLLDNQSEFPWRVMKGLSARIRNQNEMLAERVGKGLQEAVSILTLHVERFAHSIRDIALSSEEIEANGMTLAVRIKEIERISRDIAKSLNFIKDVAVKTKILGLNATIEAVRAGDYGRGFTVIAEEIQKLSQMSQKNADTITDLTAKIDVEIGEVTHTSERSAAQRQVQAAVTKNMVAAVEEVRVLSTRLSELAKSL